MTRSGVLKESFVATTAPRGGSVRRRCDFGMMIAGATLVGLTLAVALFGPGWQAQVAAFIVMAGALYMLHAALRTFSSGLYVEARAIALALHSLSFVVGQSAGPIAYGVGRLHFGKLPALLATAAAITVLAFAWVKWPRQGKRGESRRASRAAVD